MINHHCLLCHPVDLPPLPLIDPNLLPLVDLLPLHACSSGRLSSITSGTHVTSGTSTPVAFRAFSTDVIVMSFENGSSTLCFSPAAGQTNIPENEVSEDMSNGDLSLDNMVSIFCSFFN